MLYKSYFILIIAIYTTSCCDVEKRETKWEMAGDIAEFTHKKIEGDAMFLHRTWKAVLFCYFTFFLKTTNQLEINPLNSFLVFASC